MINKFQAFNLMRTPEYCTVEKEDGYTTYSVKVGIKHIGVVLSFENPRTGKNDSFTYCHVTTSGSADNLMQAFAQVVESFMNAYNEKWKKENRYEVAKELFEKDIMRNGSFISGDIIYLNDGDYGIINSVWSDGYELLMNSTNKYHSVMSDGRGVTVFGTLDKNHSLSVDWKKAFITYLDGFQPSGKTGE
nr:MAG TPA: protein of unknown function (DUF2262) [Caudoviricetes sp.]